MTWWFHLLVRRVEKLRERAAVFERVLRAVGTVPYQERLEKCLCGYEGRGVRVICYTAAGGGPGRGHEKSFYADGSRYAYGRTAGSRVARGMPVEIIRRNDGLWIHKFRPVITDDPGDYMGL